MRSPEYDVFICSSRASAGAVARTVAAALTARGFHVFLQERQPGGASRENPRLDLIREVPDFVLVGTPPVAGAPGDEDGAVRIEVAEALKTKRNIIRVDAVRSDGAGSARELSGDLAPLAAAHLIAYDPARPAESIALLAHRLSSDGTVDDRRLMRRVRNLFVAAAVILVVGIALQEIPALLERWSQPRLREAVPPFALYWSAVGQRPEADRWLSFPVADRTVVSNGDQLRVVFSTSADGFAYVLARSARGEVAVLFPTDTVRGASRVKAGEQHWAPVDGGWLTADDETSPEALFIIAGYDPQQNLEELIEEADAPAQSRRALLESSLAGLLDGRHGAAERRVWTGKLHPIDPSLPIPSLERRASVTLRSGTIIEPPLSARPGLASACVELHLAYQSRR